MVSCLHDSITEEVKVEQEEEGQENLKNQSLSEPQPKTPFVLIDQLDLCPPGLEDLSLSFADSFPDFDSIMADLGENPVGFGSKDGEFGIVEKSLEVSNDELCEETLVIEDLNRDGFCGKVGMGPGQEEGEIWAFKKGIDGFCETNKVEEELNRDGVCGKLADFGCLIEEEMGKVILDGSDGSTSLGINVNDIASGVKVVGGMSAEKSGWIDDCNSVGLESTELVNSNDNRAPKCEDVSLHEDKLKSGNILINNENQMLIDGFDNDDNESESESESESKSSSSSSSSSSSDEEDEDEDDEQSKEGEEESGDEKKQDNEDGVAVGKLVIEEGEIMLSDAEEMVGWSDDEDGGRGMAGPIKSKNELKFLPPVPSVDVTLEPHHLIQPVGIVSSIIDAQVIVEGVENHNPLNEGSILWITESRSALGIVDEVFGPVKNPYYIVRYNSETDVPVNIQQGTLVSFVPEFANHVLHDKNIYQKGYDASNENDEEMSDDLEFSDDEKEAEYKRMLKMKKRGKNEPKLGQKKDKKQFKNRSGNWNYDRDATGKASAQDNKLQIDHDQHLVNPQVGASRDQISGLVGELAMVPPFTPRVQAPGFCPPNGNWTNGFLCQQPQSMAIRPGFPGNGIPWLPQTHPQQLNQMPLPNGLPLQHQHNTIPGLPFNFVLPGGQANYGGGPTFSPWIGQNVFNQSPFGMGLPGQQTSLPVNVEGQAIQPNGSQFGYDPNLQPSPVTSGRPHDRGIGGGGRNMHQNRGARFGRGRGRHRGR